VKKEMRARRKNRARTRKPKGNHAPQALNRFEKQSNFQLLYPKASL
jgi:hypothetical protein